MEYIYINGHNSVAVERENKKVTKVFIDGEEHEFDKNDTSDKEAYAVQTKRNKYKKFLENQFENLLILTGAGSSKDVGGKLLAELWDESCKRLTTKKIEKLCELSHYLDKNEEDGSYLKNLEKLLSLANVLTP